MFAYIFWHVRPGQVDASAYETAMSQFGQALQKQQIDGVLGGACYWVDKVRWVDDPCYEDWVWVSELAVFERLNERAVSGPMESPHDKIAHLTKHGGFGGLYYLVGGKHTARGDSRVCWVSRPRGVKWRDAMPGIVASANAEVAVWRRFMVLGPAPEFAIVGAPGLQVTLPEGWTALTADRRLVGGGQGQ